MLNLLGVGAVVLLSSSLIAQTLRVDHAGICGYDLASMQRVFADLGLAAEYGGAHATGGTHNALLGFDDGSYIELIAPQHPEALGAAEAKEWSRLKPDKVHACFWAIGSSNIRKDVEKLRHAGVQISDVQPGSRKKPDGTVIAWDTARVSSGKGGELLPFLIEDKTPRRARIQPSAIVKGSELTGIEIVVVAVKDLDAGIALFRRGFDLPAPAHATDTVLGAKLAYFVDSPVLLVAAADANSAVAQVIDEFGEGPLGLLIGTKDFAASSKRFQLPASTSWFGHPVAWFDANKLHGGRLGIIGE